MRRLHLLITATTLIAASCTASGDNGATTTTPAPATTAPPGTLPAPSTLPPTTESAITTATPTTPAPSPTTTTLADVSLLPAGLFCRDIESSGYSYSEAVAYWIREGRPDRMDADVNGIPCETLYPRATVVAFWGDPLPTTTAVAELSLSDVAEQARNAWPYSDPGRWKCELEFGGTLGSGAITTCRPDPIPVDSQFPLLTGLILSDSGQTIFAESGVYLPILNVEIMRESLDPGQFCRDILATRHFQNGLVDPQHAYFGALMYWFLEGRPERMDADLNGKPCETLFEPWAVDRVWDGGLVFIYAAG